MKMTHSAVKPHSSTWAVVLTLLAHSTAGITVAAGSAIASASGEPGRGRGRRAHDHRNLANALCPPLHRRQAPQRARSSHLSAMILTRHHKGHLGRGAACLHRRRCGLARRPGACAGRHSPPPPPRAPPSMRRWAPPPRAPLSARTRRSCEHKQEQRRWYTQRHLAHAP